MSGDRATWRTLAHPLADVACHHRDARLGPRRRRIEHDRKPAPKPIPLIEGSFAPPPGTLLLGIGRQPTGFTCGTETFLGICDFLRLPVRDPDIDDIESFSKMLRTSYKTGTDPADIVRVARDYLHIDGRIESKVSITDLAQITDGTQKYIDELLAGSKPSRDLEIAMVTYQAYVDPAHERSVYFPKGRTAAEASQARAAKSLERINPIRRGNGSVIWKDDWSDGHWSAVVRVVLPEEWGVLGDIRRHLGKQRCAAEVRDGIVILGDPSNGEALSFVPIPEFADRWHDTDHDDKPIFEQTMVRLTVPLPILKEIRAGADRRGVPMFSTVARNAVIYVP